MLKKIDGNYIPSINYLHFWINSRKWCQRAHRERTRVKERRRERDEDVTDYVSKIGKIDWKFIQPKWRFILVFLLSSVSCLMETYGCKCDQSEKNLLKSFLVWECWICTLNAIKPTHKKGIHICHTHKGNLSFFQTFLIWFGLIAQFEMKSWSYFTNLKGFPLWIFPVQGQNRYQDTVPLSWTFLLRSRVANEAVIMLNLNKRDAAFIPAVVGSQFFFVSLRALPLNMINMRTFIEFVRKRCNNHW